METICITCKVKFNKKVHNQRYCSKKCRPEMHNSHFKERGVSPGTVGAIAEMRIGADLMANGYEVYRALSPSSSCDVLAIKDGKIFTFEVRTGHVNDVNGKVYYPTKPMRAERFAVFVHHNNQIIYVPDLPV